MISYMTKADGVCTNDITYIYKVASVLSGVCAGLYTESRRILAHGRQVNGRLRLRLGTEDKYLNFNT